jgi:hypothetical protein
MLTIDRFKKSSKGRNGFRLRVHTLFVPVLIIGIALASACSTDSSTSGDDAGSTSSAIEISSFSFEASNNDELSSTVDATIEGTDISATVPYGTSSVTDLVATFSFSGQKITVNGTERFVST